MTKKYIEKTMDKGMIINKTMDRADLLMNDAVPVIQSIDTLIRNLYAKGLAMTSWYGCLPRRGILPKNMGEVKSLVRKILSRSKSFGVGMENRGPAYEPLPSAADDARIPWFLYWEIYWVLKNGPKLAPSMRVLDAGGTSSLFTCYLASLGCEVHSIDINDELIENGRRISHEMGWNMHSYHMSMEALSFEDGFFDHAYSICVFEHLDEPLKKKALSEIARCLKPGGILSITFDYRNPAPVIAGYGPDTRESNRICTLEDIERIFLSEKRFELLGNARFSDNGKSFLVHPDHGHQPYTFGALFLRRKA